MGNENTVILFAKAPKICGVKTRLWPDLNYRQCLNLHTSLTGHTISHVTKSNKFNFVIYTTKPKGSWLLPFNVKIKIQHGIDLGERMYNAIKIELKHSQRVILIGSDCLEFSENYINDAFNKLKKNSDIVITPTNDGGYCLIGMKATNKFLFEKISWSTSMVLNQTCKVAKNKGKRMYLLDALNDIDTANDLEHLKRQQKLPTWAKQYIAQP